MTAKPGAQPSKIEFILAEMDDMARLPDVKDVRKHLNYISSNFGDKEAENAAQRHFFWDNVTGAYVLHEGVTDRNARDLLTSIVWVAENIQRIDIDGFPLSKEDTIAGWVKGGPFQDLRPFFQEGLLEAAKAVCEEAKKRLSARVASPIEPAVIPVGSPPIIPLASSSTVQADPAASAAAEILPTSSASSPLQDVVLGVADTLQPGLPVKNKSPYWHIFLGLLGFIGLAGIGFGAGMGLGMLVPSVSAAIFVGVTFTGTVAAAAATGGLAVGVVLLAAGLGLLVHRAMQKHKANQVGQSQVLQRPGMSDIKSGPRKDLPPRSTALTFGERATLPPSGSSEKAGIEEVSQQSNVLKH